MTINPAEVIAALEARARVAATDAEAREVLREMRAQTRRLRSIKMHGGELPPTPLAQAQELDPTYRERPHLRYLSDRLTAAVRRVEAGENVHLRVSMPPRFGKTTLIGEHFPVWLLRHHPDWSIAVVSNDSTLATKSGRAVRRTIENDPGLGVSIAPDAGAVTEWETTAKGGVLSRGYRGSIVGRGARCMILDDLVKDFVAAHSAEQRQSVWDWWLSTGQQRLERPYLVIAVGTRWHQDDFLGRLASNEHEGDPADWEEVVFPAVAEEADVLGRAPGDPLLSPLVDETPAQAAAALEQTKINVGTYAFNAQYQQRPSPAKGAIFDSDWWSFWTVNPSRVTEDGRVVLIEPGEVLMSRTSRAIESWDCAFKDTDGSDYVVGQRWARQGVRRYLLAQQRNRLSFTATVKAMKAWAEDTASTTVHTRLVEDKANGTAVIDVLKDEVDGLIPVNPTQSKEARARAVTPEVEAHNVYLPHPEDPGNEWVRDFLAECRDFPTGAHDDQVDAMTQALMRLRDPGEGSITVPTAAKGNNPIVRNVARRTIGPRTTQTPRRTT